MISLDAKTTLRLLVRVIVKGTEAVLRVEAVRKLIVRLVLDCTSHRYVFFFVTVVVILVLIEIMTRLVFDTLCFTSEKKVNSVR